MSFSLGFLAQVTGEYKKFDILRHSRPVVERGKSIKCSMVARMSTLSDILMIFSDYLGTKRFWYTESHVPFPVLKIKKTIINHEELRIPGVEEIFLLAKGFNNFREVGIG